MGILSGIDKITAGVNPPVMSEEAPKPQSQGVSHMLSKVQFAEEAL